MSDRKKAIVTGASIGMGRGIALVLAEEGYDIAFSYYGDDEQSLKYVDKTVSMLKEKGAKSWHFSADLTKKGAPKEFFDKAPQVAVNAIADACTGSNPRQPTPEEMEQLLKCVYYDLPVEF